MRISSIKVSNTTLSFGSPSLRPHLLFGVLGLASIFLFWEPLRQLVALSLSDRPYSYILVIPFISAFVLYLDRRRKSSRIAFEPRVGLPLLAAGLLLYSLFLLQLLPIPVDYWLSIVVFAIVFIAAAAFILCYGYWTFRAALFPFLLLMLFVPIPTHLMDRIVTALQTGSADATYVLFKLLGVPMFRDGVRFELPGIGIEVAEECSSIHSACALFITALLVGHVLLRTLGSKVLLSVVSIPIAMLTNAIRIVSIWFLAIKVEPGFMYGNLHRNGGLLFSLISLSVLLGFLSLLQKCERRRSTIGKGPMGKGIGAPVGMPPEGDALSAVIPDQIGR